MSAVTSRLNEVGIKIIGPVLQESDRGQVCREFCLALIKAGVTNFTIDNTSQGLFLKVDKDSIMYPVEESIGKNIPYNIVLCFEDPKSSVNYLRAEPADCKKILYSYCNTDTCHQPWALFINQYVNELWVPGEWNKAIFQAAGVKKPIKIVPAPLSHDYSTKYKVNLEAGNSATNITDSTFIFYTVGVWDEHSNMTDLLEAYWHAFTKSDDVCLIIRSYGETRSKEELQGIVLDIQTLTKESKLSNPASTVLVSNQLSYEDLVAIHTRGHCYVSTARSHPTGISAKEAILSGKPAILSPFGECANISSDFTADYLLRPVIFMEGTEYNFKQRWAQPSIVGIANKMRRLYDNRDSENGSLNTAIENLRKEHTDLDSILGKLLDVI